MNFAKKWGGGIIIYVSPSVQKVGGTCPPIPPRNYVLESDDDFVIKSKYHKPISRLVSIHILDFSSCWSSDYVLFYIFQIVGWYWFLVESELTGSGSLVGYQAMHQQLTNDQGLVVMWSIVREVWKILNPNGVDMRSRHRLRRLYHCLVDGYDKIKPFGFHILRAMKVAVKVAT